MGRHDNRTRRLMLTLLGGLAEFEPDAMRARTGKGRDRAKASGQSLGRKPKLTSCRQREPIRRRDRGEPLGRIAPSYNVSPSTIPRLAARFSYPRLLNA
jgi:DNA invertase Pin-like site-specific DNA recombinase